MQFPTLADFNEFEDLRRQVESTEYSLDHSFVPSHEALYQLRSRTEQLLQRLVPSSGHNLHASVRALLQRIMALYRRVDLISSNRGSAFPMAANPLQSPVQVFLATGPDGRQSLIMPPSAGAAMFPLPTPAPQSLNLPTGPPTLNQNVHHGVPANQNPPVVQDIVHQAVVNQQRRREGENAPQGQYMRRIWLFIRLYFFIYMFSSSGSWARFFLVGAAVLVALLSETDIPHQLHGMLVAPLQRHLENLTQIGGGPAGPAAEAAGNPNTTTNQAGGNAADTALGELWTSIRRLERAMVLLIASLIPGIGERQVQARNAADEAEAERRRQEEQQQQQQEQVQVERAPDVVANDAVESDTAVNSGATEPQPEQAVLA